jgi:hypothetical protein
VAIALVDELRQRMGDHDGGDVQRDERISEQLPRMPIEPVFGAWVGERASDISGEFGHSRATADVGVVLPERRVLVTALPKELGQRHDRITLGTNRVLQGGQSIRDRTKRSDACASNGRRVEVVRVSARRHHTADGMAVVFGLVRQRSFHLLARGTRSARTRR